MTRGRGFGRALRGPVAQHGRHVYARLLREAAGIGRGGAGRARRARRLGARLARCAGPRRRSSRASRRAPACTPIELLGGQRAHRAAGGRVPPRVLASSARRPGRLPRPDLGLASRPRAGARRSGRSSQAGGRWFTTRDRGRHPRRSSASVERRASPAGSTSSTCDADGGIGRACRSTSCCALVLERCDGRGGRASSCSLGSRSRRRRASRSRPPTATLVAAELSPGGARSSGPDADGWLVHTNHFLAAPPRGHATRSPASDPGTLLRRAHLDAMLRRGVGAEQALAAHRPAGGPVCRHADAGAPGPTGARRSLAVSMEPAAGAPARRRRARRATRPSPRSCRRGERRHRLDHGRRRRRGRAARRRAAATRTGCRAARSARTGSARGLERVLDTLDASGRCRRRSTSRARRRSAIPTPSRRSWRRGHELGHHGHAHVALHTLLGRPSRPRELGTGCAALAPA